MKNFAISLVASLVLGACGSSWTDVVHDQGYWPMKTPDSGLLMPGTIANIKRDNPVEFNTLCGPEAWGVTTATREAKGLTKLDIATEFSTKINAEIKKGLKGDIGAKYDKKDIVKVVDVVLVESYVADLFMDGSKATADCRNAVINLQSQKLAASVVNGNFRASVEFSSEASVDIGLNADLKSAVSATIGIAATSKANGTGTALVWGIKYINLPNISSKGVAHRPSAAVEHVALAR